MSRDVLHPPFWITVTSLALLDDTHHSMPLDFYRILSNQSTMWFKLVPFGSMGSSYRFNPGHLSDLPALCKWFGASANANFNLYASATNTLMLESVQFCVGTFWSNIMRPWKSFSNINLSLQWSRKAAHTYSWKIAKPSDSARYVSHKRIVQGRGISLVSRLFIHRNENWR